MVLVLVFACTLVAAVLLSGLAHRSVLSTAALFLVAGFLMGDGGLGVVSLSPSDPLESTLATVALFAVLFTDGMHAGVSNLKGRLRLPGRALAIGMPLTFLLNTALVGLLTPLSWPAAALVGAILTPTDPVFAEAIVSRKEVPSRLRNLLNVESGLNDGLALPVVLLLLGTLAHSAGEGHGAPTILFELLLGVVVGVVVPFVLVKVERSRFFEARGRYEPLNAFAIGLLVFAICSLTAANPFLAAFAAGSTVASISKEVRESFEHFGELVSELLKLGALLVFGALLSGDLLVRVGLSGFLTALGVVVLVRLVALPVALWGERLPRRELLAAAWFGPKGFASVTYGLLVLASGAPGSSEAFDLVALTVALSILLHSSTDVVVARWFHDDRDPDRTRLRDRLPSRLVRARRSPAALQDAA